MMLVVVNELAAEMAVLLPFVGRFIVAAVALGCLSGLIRHGVGIDRIPLVLAGCLGGLTVVALGLSWS